MNCFPCAPVRRGIMKTATAAYTDAKACPVCGPSLRILDEIGNPLSDKDPLQKAIDLLCDGYVLAIKGLGGFHLAVDAANDEALQRLRSRKFREEKPLAIMVKDLEAASRIAWIGNEESALLCSPQRPIVLARKKETREISPAVAPRVSDLGIMLPYTPVHHMLLEKHFQALVMTSANQVDEPICITNREAIKRLHGIADYFLVHNRDILVRCDDSIATVSAGEKRMLRRSRGFAPKPIVLKKS